MATRTDLIEITIPISVGEPVDILDHGIGQGHQLKWARQGSLGQP